MTNAVRSFKMEMTDAHKVVDTYSKVAASSATSVQELATAMSKTASSAEAVGASFESTTAMMAVMIEATRESAQNIGSAMKSIISRYGELTTDPSKLVDSEGEEMSLNRVDKALRTVGITIKDANGQFRSFSDVIEELADVWDTLDKNSQRYIATIMAGNRQQSRFLALVSSGERLKELTSIAENSEDASELQIAKTVDSLEYKIQQLKTSMQSIYTDAGLQDIYKWFLDVGNNIAKTFADMGRWGKLPIPAIIKIGTTFWSMAQIVAAAFAFIKGQFQAMEAAINAKGKAGTATRLSDAANETTQKGQLKQQEVADAAAADKAKTDIETAGTGNRINNAQAEAAGKRNAAQGGAYGMSKGALGLSLGLNALSLVTGGIATNMPTETKEQRRSKGLMNTASTGLSTAAMGAIIGSMIPGIGTVVGAIIGGVGGAAVSGFKTNKELIAESPETTLKYLKEKSDKSRQEYLTKKSTVKDLQSEITELEKLQKARYDSVEANEQYIEASNRIAEQFPYLVSGYDSEGNAIIDLQESYKQLAAARREAAEAGKESGEDALTTAVTAADNAEKNRDKAVAENRKKLFKEGTSLNDAYKNISDNVFNDPLQALGLQLDEEDYTLIGSTGDAEERIKSLFNFNSVNEDIVFPTSLIDIGFFYQETIRNINSSFQDLFSENADKRLQAENFFNQLITENNDIWELWLSSLPDQSVVDAIRNIITGSSLSNANTAVETNIEQLNHAVDRTIITNIHNKIKDFIDQTLNDPEISLGENQKLLKSVLQDFPELSDAIYNNVDQAFMNYLKEYAKDKNYSSVEELSNEDKQKAYDEFINSASFDEVIAEIYNDYNQLGNLVGSQNKRLAELIKNSGRYTKNQFVTEVSKVLKGVENGMNIANQLGEDLYTEVFTNSEMADGLLKNYGKGISGMSGRSNAYETISQLSNSERRQVYNVFSDTWDLVESGTYTEDQARQYLNNYLGMWDQAVQVGDEAAQSVIEKWQGTGLSDVTTLEEQLKAAGVKEELISGIIESAITAVTALGINIPLELSTYASQVAEASENLEKAIKNATEGMDLPTAEKLASSLGTDLSDESFKFLDGKWYYDNLQKIREHYLSGPDSLAEKLEEEFVRQINEATETSDYFTDAASIVVGQEDLAGGDKLTKAFGQLSLLEDFEESVFTKEGFDANIARQVYEKLGKDTSSEDLAKEYINLLIQSYVSDSELVQKAIDDMFIRSTIKTGDVESAIKYALQDTNFDATEIINFIQGGQIQEALMAAGGHLDNYVNELITVATNASKSTFDFLTNGLTSTQYISIKNMSVELKALIEKNKNSTWIQEVKDSEDQLIGYYTQITRDNIFEVQQFAIQYLKENNTDSAKKSVRELLKKAHNTQYENTGYEALLSTYDSVISYENAVDFILDMDLLEDFCSVEDAMTNLGFSYNKLSGEFTATAASAEAFKLLLDGLYHTVITPFDKDINKAKAAIAKTSNRTSTINDAVDTAIKNRNKLTEDNINTIADAFEADYDFIESNFTTLNANGTRSLNTAAFLKYLNDRNEGMENTLSGVITGMTDTLYDETYSSIKQIGNIQTSGLEKRSEAQAIVDDINSVLSDGDKVNFDAIFDYDDALNKWVLSAQGVKYSVELAKQRLIESGISNDKASQQIRSQLGSQLFGDIDLTKFISDGMDFTSQTWQTIQQSLESYNATLVQLGTALGFTTVVNEGETSKLLQLTSQNLQAILMNGGEQAVAAIQAVGKAGGKDISAEDIKQAYRSQVEQIVAAQEQVNLGVGEVINGKYIHAILEGAGYGFEQLGNSDSYVIKSIGDVVQAYTNVYHQLANSGEATVSEINAAAAAALTAQDKKQTDAIGAMQNAFGMSWETLAGYFDSIGKNMYVELAGNGANNYGIERTGAGGVNIVDFQAFAGEMGWSAGSEEYVSAFKTYNDSLIQFNERVESQILAEAQGLGNIDYGKELNLTYISDVLSKSYSTEDITAAINSARMASQYGGNVSFESVLKTYPTALKRLNDSLSDYGVKLENGILTPIENATIDSIGASREIASYLSALNFDGRYTEAIQSILSNITASLNNAVSSIASYSLGDAITGDAAKVLVSKNEGWRSQYEQYGQVVLNSAKEYMDAAQAVYETVRDSFDQGTSSIKDLNDAFTARINASIINTRSSVKMGILKNASGFDLNALESFFNSMGLRMDEYLDQAGELLTKGLDAGISRTGINSYKIVDWDKFRKAFEGKLTETSDEYIDAYISYLSSSETEGPNTKEAFMASIIPNLNKLTLEQVGQIAKRFELSVKQVQDLLKENADGTYNGNALYNELDFDKNNKAVTDAFDSTLKGYGETFTSAITTFSQQIYYNAGSAVYDWDNYSALKQAVDDYKKGMQSLGKKVEGDSVELAFILSQGGEAAVQVAQQIASDTGITLSAENIESIYRAQIAPLVNSIDTVTSQAGSIVDQTTASLINMSSGVATQLGQTGQYVVESAANLYQAYSNLLKLMESTGEATLSDLNKVAALALENRDGQQVAIDALGDAANMTFTRFGEILAQGGYRLTEELVNGLKAAGVIDLIGGNKMRITDFKEFAKLMKWKEGSEEYVSAFKTYNDSMIDMNRKVERNILEEVQKLSGAKGGDWINLTQLSDKLNKSRVLDLGTGKEIIPLQDMTDALANYGGILQDGILQLNSDADLPNIIATIASYAQQYGGLLRNEMAQLADTLADILKGYADLIKNGLSGTLTNVQGEQLTGWAEQMGIEVDFTRTVEGLKISRESAWELYEALKEVDSIAAGEAFDSIVESYKNDTGGGLQTSNEILGDIAKKEREIRANEEALAPLRKELAKAAKDLDRESKKETPDAERIEELNSIIANDKERIAIIQGQNDRLKEQVGILGQIANAQAASPGSFKFMDRALPDNLQGPMNYWDAIGKMFTSMNESAKTGRMGMQDFYNIVNEFSNLAAVSGKEIVVGGITLDGSAEQASKLITKGFGALQNIDGKGVMINLKDIGVDFSSGASDMRNGVADGIHEVAQSQIDMLDAAIQMLEVIVQMEKLGDIDVDNSNTIDLGEIFKLDVDENVQKDIDEDGNTIVQYTQEWLRTRSKWLKMLTEGSEEYNEDFAKAAENISINGHSFKELLETNNPENLGLDYKTYTKLWNDFYQTTMQDNWSLDDIQASWLKSLQESNTLPEGLTIDVGDYTIGINGNAVYQIDWSSSKTTAGLDELGGDNDQNRQKLRELLAKWTQGEPLEGEEFRAVLKATGIIAVDTDGSEYVTDIDGKEYKAGSDGARQALAKQLMKSIGGEGNGEIALNDDGSSTISETFNVNSAFSYNAKVTLDAEGEPIYEYSANYLGREFKSGTLEGLKTSMYQAFRDEQFRKLVNGDVLTRDDANSVIPTYAEWEATYAVKVDPHVTLVGKDGDPIEANDPSIIDEIDQMREELINGTFLNHEGFKEPELKQEIDGGPIEYVYHWGDITITSDHKLDDNELVQKGQELAGIDKGAIANIALGISKAFEEGGASEKISAALVTGIRDGLSGNKEKEIPAPTLTIAPEKLIVNAEGASLELGESGEGKNSEWKIPVDSVNAEASTLNLTLAQNVSKNTESISKDLGVIDETFTAGGLINTLLLISDKDPDIMTAPVILPNDTTVTVGSVVEGIINTIKGTGDNAILDPSSAVQIGEGESITITQAIQAIVSTLKLTSGENGINVEDDGLNLNTLPSPIEVITAYLETVLLEWNGGKKNFDLSSIITDGEILETPTKEITVPVGNVKFEYVGGETGIGIANTWKENGFGPDTYERVQQRYGESVNWWSTQVVPKQEVKDYVAKMQELVDAGNQLGEVDLNNLLVLKSAFSTGEENATFVSSITNLLTQIDIQNDNLSNLTNFASQFSNLTIGELPEISTALSEILSSAAQLQQISWSSIAQGIQSIFNVKGDNPLEESPVSEILTSLNIQSITANNSSIDAFSSNISISDPTIVMDSPSIKATSVTVSGASSSPTPQQTGGQQSTQANVEVNVNTSDVTQATNDINAAKSAITGAIDGTAESMNRVPKDTGASFDNGAEGMDSAATKANNLGDATSKIQDKSQAIRNVANAIQSLKSTDISLGITINAAIKATGDGTATGTLSSLSTSNGSISRRGSLGARWSKQARAKGTLVGELGPELIVSNGRYFVVGQNGPEMVNLAEDAIVFNHLQTQSLLNNGRTKTRGKPVTNERKATALAGGNSSWLDKLGWMMIYQQMLGDMPYTGNADMANRPIVPWPAMEAKGWGEGSKYDYATINGTSYSVGDMFIGVTPILPNGQILTPEQLDVYVKSLISTSQYTGKSVTQIDAERNGLLLNVTPIYNTEAAEEVAKQHYEYMEKLHEAQADWDTIRTSKTPIQALSQYIFNKQSLKKTLTSIQDSKNKNVRGMTKAKGTLMGELGPELVVSNGRYFVAGQNGPEFVDLANDAIVFNHKQTADLLKRGKASSRGKAVTSDLAAISMAKGSLNGGPAQASASAALAALKELRAQWQALLGASLKDLGAMGGGSGGGGGGGGGDNKFYDGIIEDVEQWYNWLRRIKELETDINMLAKEYSISEKNRASTTELYENLTKQYKAQVEMVATETNLADRMDEEYNDRIQKIQDNESPLSGFYTVDPESKGLRIRNNEDFLSFIQTRQDLSENMRNALANGITQMTVQQKVRDEEGNIVYEGKGKNKTPKLENVTIDLANGGLSFLNELFKEMPDGTSKYTAEAQFNMIKELGLGREFLQYDDKGNAIFTDWANVSEEEMQKAVENWYSKIEGAKDSIDNMKDSLDDHREKALAARQAIQTLNESIEKLYAVTEGVVKQFDEYYNWTQLITESQKEINRLTKEYSILQKDFIANGEAMVSNIFDQIKTTIQQRDLDERLNNERRQQAAQYANDIANDPLYKTFLDRDEATGRAFYTGNEDFANAIKSSALASDAMREAAAATLRGEQATYTFTRDRIKQDAQGNYLDENGNIIDKIDEALYQHEVTEITLPLEMSVQGLIDMMKQGKYGNVELSADEQFDLLVQMGFLKYMQYDKNGKRIFNNAATATNDEKRSGVEALLDKITSEADDNNKLIEDINKTQEDILNCNSNLLQSAEQLRQIVTQVENDLKNAVVAERQEIIDRLEDEKDAIDEAADRLVDGLTDALNKERELYESDKNEKELRRLQNQLAIAQRSGGDISTIRNLQEQIQSKQRDMYFNERQQEIDAIKEAADKQIQKLDDQLEVMKETLDYQTKNGLLWTDIYTMLDTQTPQQIAAYIAKHDSDYLAASAEQQNTLYTKTLENVEGFKAIQDDLQKSNQALIDSNGSVQRLLEYVLNTTVSNEEGIKTEELADVFDEPKEVVIVEDKTESEPKIDPNANLSNDWNTYAKEAMKLGTARGNAFAEFWGGERDIYSNAYKNATGDKDTAGRQAAEAALDEREQQYLNDRQASYDSYVQWFRDNEGEDSVWLKYLTDIYTQNSATDVRSRAQAFKDAFFYAYDQQAAGSNRAELAMADVNQQLQALHDSLSQPVTTMLNGTPITLEYDDVEVFNTLDDFINGIVSHTLTKGTELSVVSRSNEKIGGNDKKKRRAIQLSDGTYIMDKDRYFKKNGKNIIKGLPRFKQGGLADFTGLAMLDGTPAEPEHVLKDEQLNELRDLMLHHIDLTSQAIHTLNTTQQFEMIQEAFNDRDYGCVINIENASVNMNVDHINNDYDARRAGEQALDEMVRIARKTGTRSLSRR